MVKQSAMSLTLFITSITVLPFSKEKRRITNCLDFYATTISKMFQYTFGEIVSSEITHIEKMRKFGMLKKCSKKILYVHFQIMNEITEMVKHLLQAM